MLSDKESQALLHLLQAEINHSNTFNLRIERFEELYSFNYNLNLIASELMQILVGGESLSSFKVADSSFFDMQLPDSLLSYGVNELKRNGYWISPIAFSTEHIYQALECLKDFEFNSISLPPQTLSGLELLKLIEIGSSPDQKYGDIYWSIDQNKIVHSEFFNRLAFDPFILSIANGYFGCPPIHDQTNIWFSFPTKIDANNLSKNAQLFHQDKDFIKFLKVFIYLTDVNEENGPHSYVEGSHRDPLHDYGIPLHTRVDNMKIVDIYGAKRVKTIIGKAGYLVFADTSCAHKGSPLISGSRLMLQLEYTTSLYLSQICPFSTLNMEKTYKPSVSNSFFKRISANYNSLHRKIFQQDS